MTDSPLHPPMHELMLGRQVAQPKTPDEAELHTIPNNLAPFCARFTIPEFTSLCPITGQPDFAHITIDYVHKGKTLESKALKLFMTSFRNHGEYHEQCTMYIARRLMQALDPKWLRVVAFWNPRGGIPIDVFWQSGNDKVTLGMLIPPLPLSPYTARIVK
jgi:7-cyano-7-deazaguanine reductase